MTKYLLLYRAPVSAAEQMASSTPEAAQAGMEAWMAWGERAGSARRGHGLAAAGRFWQR